MTDIAMRLASSFIRVDTESQRELEQLLCDADDAIVRQQAIIDRLFDIASCKYSMSSIHGEYGVYSDVGEPLIVAAGKDELFDKLAAWSGDCFPKE